MKKKSFNKKLVLSKESVANLNDEKMLNVKGGGTVGCKATILNCPGGTAGCPQTDYGMTCQN